MNISSSSSAVKRPFDYNDQVMTALVNSHSHERMRTYVAESGGDLESALRLYAWNAAVSAAFYGPLQGLEIALRNAMHRELTATFGAEWYENARCGFDAKTSNTLSQARSDLSRHGFANDPCRIVASLSFGFWVALLGSGGKKFDACNANYEMTLWRPALHKVFRHTKPARRKVHAPIEHLRRFRNRIAHHEPVFGQNLQGDYESILEVTGWICPATRDWIAHHSRVGEVLNIRAGDPALKF